MSLKPVRTFIKTRLSETNSSFKEHKDGFNRDNIHRSQLNKSYFIDIVSSDNESTEGRVVTDEIVARVEVFYKGFRNTQSAIDNALDEINNFKLRASNPSNFTSTIKRAVCESIEVEQLNESNDNSFILTINMSVTACFAVI